MVKGNHKGAKNPKEALWFFFAFPLRILCVLCGSFYLISNSKFMPYLCGCMRTVLLRTSPVCRHPFAVIPNYRTGIYRFELRVRIVNLYKIDKPVPHQHMKP